MSHEEPGADTLETAGGAPEDGLPRGLTVLLAAACTISLSAALVVALGGFTWGLPSKTHVQSYHPDEQNVTYSLRNMNPAKLDFNPRFFGNPTFYTYQVGAVAFAASLVGILPRDLSEEYWLSHPEAIRRFYILGRGLSLVYAALSVYLLYLVSLEVTRSRRAALLAAAVFASLPVFAVHSHYMTVNSSAVFWSLASLLFALRIRESKSVKNYLLAGLFAGFAISTKFNNAFLPLAIVAAHFQAKHESRAKLVFDANLWAALLACGAGFLAGSPYYLLAYGDVRSDPHNRMNMKALADLGQPIAIVARHFWNHLSGSCGRLLAAVFLISVPACLGRARKRLAPLLIIAIPFLALGLKSGWWAFGSRMMPVLALLSVFTAALVAGESTARYLRTAFAAVAAAALLATVPWNLAYFNLMRAEHIRSEASRWIEANIPAGSTIIVLDEPYFDDPDIVYENALHGPLTTWPRYKIENLEGYYDAVWLADGEWLVIPQRFEDKLKASGRDGIEGYTKKRRFHPVKVFRRRFAVFGLELRDWVPADMVQNYPVYIFRRDTPDRKSGT